MQGLCVVQFHDIQRLPRRAIVRRLIKPKTKNYKRPEKERKGGRGWLTHNQTKGAYNIGMRKKNRFGN